MKIEDKGYILSKRKYGDNSLIITLLSKENGKISGFVKNAMSKKNAGVFEIGNLVKFSWYSRLEEGLGQMSIELEKSNFSKFLLNYKKLDLYILVHKMIEICINEREESGDFFRHLGDFINFIDENEDILKCYERYILMECNLLDELGVGFDLSKCASTGEVDNLVYVSPKTARAVSFDAGRPYKSKLLELPEFILKAYNGDNFENMVNESDIVKGLKLTGFFLNKNFFNLHNIKLPDVRLSLIDRIGE